MEKFKAILSVDNGHVYVMRTSSTDSPIRHRNQADNIESVANIYREQGYEIVYAD